MDIKSKSFSHSLLVKFIVFLIVIASFTNTIFTFFTFVNESSSDFVLAFKEDYYSSDEYHNEWSVLYREAYTLVFEYRSEEYIKSGKALKHSNLESNISDLFDEYDDRIYEKEIEEKGYVDRYYSYGDSDLPKEIKDDFHKVYKEEIELARQMAIKEQLNQFKYLEEKIMKDNNVEYYLTNGSDIYTNSKKSKPEEFKKNKVYMLLDKSFNEIYPSVNGENKYDQYLNLDYITHEFRSRVSEEDLDIEDTKIYIGLKDSYVDLKVNEWNENKLESKKFIKEMLVNLLVLLVSFILYLVLLGRSYFGDDEIKMNIIDRIYTDFNLIICIFIIFFWFYNIGNYYFKNSLGLIGITSVLGAIGLVFVSSLVKHMKNGSIITHSLTYKVFAGIINFFRELFNSSSVTKKVVLLVVIYPFVVAITIFVFPVTIMLAAWQALKKAKNFQKIKEGVKIIKGGDLDYKIDIEDKGEFKDLSEDINSITDGLKNAVDNELRSERLRNELITNVSHDIRTPLTSIITYIDLLKNEDKEEKRQEYLEVLDNKSHRLKVLIDDLFEASKASSGSIPVEFNKINIVSLVSQGLGEVSDKIEENSLDFITKYDSDEIYVYADGDLLWRAIENLLSNIFKYSLKGSRVYVDIREDEKFVYLIMKNISGYELNITEKELMERFKRGDESRTSEGSGLGLSIAESLIDLQKGEFKINIDGDLFKTIIKLPKYE